jgi:hypothetical protein
MPNPSLYPIDWPAIACLVKEANEDRCQACNKQCRRPGELYLGPHYELTLAHLDRCYEAEATTVAALCVPCHFRYDAPFVWQSRRRALRLRQVAAGQIALLAL